MTVVAALRDAGRVVLAADSCTVDGGDIRFPNTRKLFDLPAGTDRVVIGCAGRASYNLVLRHGLKIEASPIDDEDPDAWAAAIAQAAWEIADASKIVDKDGEIDGVALLAWRNRLWLMGGDQTLIPCDRPVTIGSGGQVALGALDVLTDSSYTLGLDAETIAGRAVAAACAHHATCGGPIQVLATTPDGGTSAT